MSKDIKQVDLSVVVNIHSGTSYLKRTMLSLEEAARYAASFDIRSELLIVMDRSPREAMAWVHSYRSNAFHDQRIIEVNHGSLGLSRIAGLCAAQAEIVMFWNEDDLISFNTFSEFYSLAKFWGPKSVIVPEYLLAFSRDAYIVRYFGSSVYSPLQFISCDPFISRICIHKSTLELASYSNVKPASLYACEDWHLNSKLAAQELEFMVAPNTILFYRTRSNSLVKTMNAQTTKQIPPTSLFNLAEYLKVCSKDYLAREALASLQQCKVANSFNDFFSSSFCMELTRAANLIDPGIIALKARGTRYTNLDMGLKRGTAYFKACQIVGSANFTDVVLLAYPKATVGENVIYAVLDALAELALDTRVLVLTGECLPEQYGWEGLEENSTIIDWQSLERNLTDDDVDVLTLKLIEATAQGARIHVGSSRYGHRFVAKFSELLTINKIIYYHSPDAVTSFDGLEFEQGDTFSFISENIRRLSLIISDDRQVIEHNTFRIDSGREKWMLLSLDTQRPLEDQWAEFERKSFQYRLLWWCPHERKRAQFLRGLAERLCQIMPKISIDIYGSPESFDIVQLESYSNLNYLGEHADFAESKPWNYDALIYTPSCDGVPDIILTAMAAGLTAIAPDVGQVGEVIIDGETGFLLPNLPDAELVNAYCAAITALYSDNERFMRLRRNALHLVCTRRSRKAFFDRVSEIFGLPHSDR